MVRHGSVGGVLRLTDSLYAAIVAHAKREAPIEACGLLAGSPEYVRSFHPVTNAAASERRFVLDGTEMLAAERLAEDSGDVIVGVMHSHTQTPAWPSATDIADAARFDPAGVFHHLIVSTATSPCEVRAFRLDGAHHPTQSVIEIAIQVRDLPEHVSAHEN